MWFYLIFLYGLIPLNDFYSLYYNRDIIKKLRLSTMMHSSVKYEKLIQKMSSLIPSDEKI